MYSNMAAWKIPGWFGDFPGIADVWGRQTGPEGISHYVKLYPTTSHYVNGGFLKWGTWVSILKCSSDLDDLGYLGVPWLRNPPNISHYTHTIIMMANGNCRSFKPISWRSQCWKTAVSWSPCSRCSRSFSAVSYPPVGWWLVKGVRLSNIPSGKLT